MGKTHQQCKVRSWMEGIWKCSLFYTLQHLATAEDSSRLCVLSSILTIFFLVKGRRKPTDHLCLPPVSDCHGGRGCWASEADAGWQGQHSALWIWWSNSKRETERTSATLVTGGCALWMPPLLSSEWGGIIKYNSVNYGLVQTLDGSWIGAPKEEQHEVKIGGLLRWCS